MIHHDHGYFDKRVTADMANFSEFTARKNTFVDALKSWLLHTSTFMYSVIESDHGALTMQAHVIRRPR